MEQESVCLSKSVAFWEMCKDVIPAGASTLAKSPNRLIYGKSPFYAQRANQSHFWDVDGNQWLDCEMAMGTVIWGHCKKEIDNAIIAQLQKGVHFSIPSTLEYELAERLLNRFPWYQGVKFFTNGADAVYSCVRAARYLSGRLTTISCEYHGWLDWASPTYYHCSPRVLGIPDEISLHHISCYGGVPELLDKICSEGSHLAAVVLCPANYAPEDLTRILDACHKQGVFSIFDEVTSGYRFAKGGATLRYSLRPDYLCLSKGMTNGLPLAVALGEQENILVMEQLKISNAHAGSHLSLAAALACEDLLDQVKVWPSWKPQTDKLLKRLSDILTNHSSEHRLELSGSAGCFSIFTPGTDFLQDPFRIYMMEFLAHHNIFSKGYIIFSDAHTKEEIDYVGDCLIECVRTYVTANS